MNHFIAAIDILVMLALSTVMCARFSLSGEQVLGLGNRDFPVRFTTLGKQVELSLSKTLAPLRPLHRLPIPQSHDGAISGGDGTGTGHGTDSGEGSALNPL